MGESLGLQQRIRKFDPEFIRAVYWGALAVFWAVTVGNAQSAARFYVLGPAPIGIDAHAYWLAANTWHPYGLPPGTPDAFLYSPVIVQLLHLVGWVSWPVFIGVWMTAEAAVFAWLVSPLRARWAIPLWLLCVPEILLGNIVGFLCLAVVAGVSSRPQAWAFPFLTKIVPGGLGMLWFVARGQWRPVFKIAAFTAAVAVVSFVFSPSLWAQWVDFLMTNNGQASGGWFVVARIMLAAALVVAGARNGRVWVLAPALLVATPVLEGHPEGLAYLAAIPQLLRVQASSLASRRPRQVVAVRALDRNAPTPE